MKESRRTERLPCELTLDEVRTRGESAARLYAERTDVEADIESKKTTAKAKVKAIDGQIHQLKVRTCSEVRDVQVIDRENWDNREVPVMETIRTDTGERARPLTVQERQGKLLPLEEGGASASA